MEAKRNYSVPISFEGITMPCFQDILVIAKKCPQGMNAMSKCLQIMAPSNFELVVIEDNIAEAILVNKRILKRMPAETIVNILREKVFPYIVEGESVKVDFPVKIFYEPVEGALEE